MSPNIVFMTGSIVCFITNHGSMDVVVVVVVCSMHLCFGPCLAIDEKWPRCTWCRDQRITADSTWPVHHGTVV